MGFAEVLQQASDRFTRGENQFHSRHADDFPKGGESPERDLHMATLFMVPSKHPFPMKCIVRMIPMRKPWLISTLALHFSFEQW
jgi:hypothetical protein